MVTDTSAPDAPESARAEPEPVLTGEITVGAGTFHRGVKLSTVQASIDRHINVYLPRLTPEQRAAGQESAAVGLVGPDGRGHATGANACAPAAPDAPTPETDAMYRKHADTKMSAWDSLVEYRDLARKLERELDAARDEVLKRIDQIGDLIASVSKNAPPVLAASIFTAAKVSAARSATLRAEGDRGCACRFALKDGWLVPETECGYHRALRDGFTRSAIGPTKEKP